MEIGKRNENVKKIKFNAAFGEFDIEAPYKIELINFKIRIPIKFLPIDVKVNW